MGGCRDSYRAFPAPNCTIVPNFVAVVQIVWAYIGNGQNMGCHELTPWIWGMVNPLQTFPSPNYVNCQIWQVCIKQHECELMGREGKWLASKNLPLGVGARSVNTVQMLPTQWAASWVQNHVCFFALPLPILPNAELFLPLPSPSPPRGHTPTNMASGYGAVLKLPYSAAFSLKRMLLVITFGKGHSTIKDHLCPIWFITFNDLFRWQHFRGLCNNICYFSHVNKQLRIDIDIDMCSLFVCYLTATFNTNRTYRTIVVGNISRRARRQHRHIIKQWNNTINQYKVSLHAYWPYMIYFPLYSNFN